MKDYYAILGVSRDADQEQIKKAYRRLARRYHPDVAGGDDECEARFKEINEAYEVLGDPEKRHRYDLFGDEGLAASSFERGFDGFGRVFARSAGETRRSRRLITAGRAISPLPRSRYQQPGFACSTSGLT